MSLCPRLDQILLISRLYVGLQARLMQLVRAENKRGIGNTFGILVLQLEPILEGSRVVIPRDIPAPDECHI